MSIDFSRIAEDDEYVGEHNQDHKYQGKLPSELQKDSQHEYNGSHYRP